MKEQGVTYNPYHVYFQIDRTHTNYVNRIIEGYEYLGVMTTVNDSGLCMLRTTADTKELACQVLCAMDVPVQIVDHCE